jgi:putative DNA primase/helicase
MSGLVKPFSVVMADGKLANIVGELEGRDLSSEVFKIAVGGEELIAAHKGKPEYPLKFNARLIFAMNNPPNFKDSSAGNYEKLCILPFDRYIAPEERDVNIRSKLLAELPGVLNWALDGLTRLKERGRLPQITALDETLTEYRAANDTVFEWAQEFVRYDCEAENAYILGQFYGHYAEWCHRQGRFALSKSWFVRGLSRELKAKMPILTNMPNNKTRIFGKFFISAKPSILDGL